MKQTYFFNLALSKVDYLAARAPNLSSWESILAPPNTTIYRRKIMHRTQNPAIFYSSYYSILQLGLDASLCNMWYDQAKWVWTRKNENTDICFIASLISWALYCWKPYQKWTYGSSAIAISVILKTIKYKGN